MPQHRAVSTGLLRSLQDTFGEAQLVAVPNRVVLDLQTRNYDTAGVLHKDYALASLSVDAAIRLRDMLSEAITAAASLPPSQSGIWSDATNRPDVRRPGRAAA